MNRRRILNSINRDIDRKRGINAADWFAGQSFHQSAEMPFERLSIADLDKVGPKLVTTLPVERAICIYCTSEPASDANFPYCSPLCGASAETDR